MAKLFHKLLLVVVCLASTVNCGGQRDGSPERAALQVFVSILPQQFFVERIAGDAVEVQVFVGQGQSPATFEPTTRQMVQLARSRVYFTIGVPFEQSLLPRIHNNFPSVAIIAMQQGIPAKQLPVSHPEPDAHQHEVDPHVWLSPNHAQLIARNVLDAITRLLPEQQDRFEENYHQLISDLRRLDAEIARVLAPLEGTEIFVFHPAFGYFMDAYGLIQVAIEPGGIASGSKRLAQLTDRAKAKGVKAVFVQPQYSATAAQNFAASVGAEVITIDPLSSDYIDNLREMANKIHSAFDNG